MEYMSMNMCEHGEQVHIIQEKIDPNGSQFKPDVNDFVFAVKAFVLGYFFSSWVLFSWQGWGVTAFTTVYLYSSSKYLSKKGAFVKSREVRFWWIITFLIGVSYALWYNQGLAIIRGAFLFCSAVYYIIAASGTAIMGKTGNFLMLDAINAFLIIPFGNILNQYVSFKGLRDGTDRHKKILSIVIGLLLSVLLVLCLNPLLHRADSGGFRIVSNFITNVFTIPADFLRLFYFHLIFTFPVAAYIYGLVSGAAHKKATGIFKPESAKKAAYVLRVMQPITVHIAIGTVCGLYLLFIFCQLPYFFSAFSGNRPEGWLVYSEYARQGFFELCWIATINLFIILLGNVMCKKDGSERKLLKTYNIVLALITLVLIATAFSKMALYINAYGLTMRRLLPCVFMVFLAAVFIALMILQKRMFSIMRFALILGAVMLCVLFLLNPDALVIRYNTNRYINGTLSEIDVDMLYNAGFAGIRSAIWVYDTSTDADLKRAFAFYLQGRKESISNMPIWDSHLWGGGSNMRNLELYQALWATYRRRFINY